MHWSLFGDPVRSEPLVHDPNTWTENHVSSVKLKNTSRIESNLTDLFLIFLVFDNIQHFKLRPNSVEVYIRFPRVVSIIRQVYLIKKTYFYIPACIKS